MPRDSWVLAQALRLWRSQDTREHVGQEGEREDGDLQLYSGRSETRYS